MIDTASNRVVATVPTGITPFGVAITPDGKLAYITGFDFFDSTGIVVGIDTTTNMTAPWIIREGSDARGVGIVPPPPGLPFLTFNANLNLDIPFGTAPNQDAFALGTSFTLSSTAPVINPLTDPVTLQIGAFAVTIPPGSFKKNHRGDFIFTGVINGVTLEALIKPTGTLRYAFQAKGVHASFTGTTNTVYVTLAIGGDSGATSVKASISH